jgi:hypothetical protein
MYINGVAEAVSPAVDYAGDNLTSMTVGSNTTGSGEFFSGIIDELTMSLYGTSDNSTAYGAYNFASENAFAAFTLTGVPGDLNHSGTLTQADKDDFIAGWMSRKIVNGLQIGDLETFGDGDINFDGVTNIFDLALMQIALSGAGVGAITAADLARGSVPEPATAALVLLAAFAIAARRGGRP